MAPEQIIQGMPEADYFAHPALSCSGARLLLPPSCPAIFRWRQDNPRPDTRVFDEGHAVHQLTLGVGAPIARLDFTDRRTKAYKDAEAEARAAGEIPLLAEQHDMVLAMREALRSHPIAGPLFERTDAKAEASIFWHHEDYSIDCRGRVDWLIEGGSRPVVVDLKSTGDASPAAFAKSAANYDYAMQDAFYSQGVGAATGSDDVGFIFIAQAKTPPYLVMAYELDAEAKAIGRAKMDMAMEIFRDCTEADVWPGYGEGILSLSLPGWADRDFR